MSPHHDEISYEKCVVVVVLRHLTGLKFVEIAKKLDLETNSINKLYNRVLERKENDFKNTTRVRDISIVKKTIS